MLEIKGIADFVLNVKLKFSTLSYFVFLLNTRKEEIEEYIKEVEKVDELTEEDQEELQELRDDLVTVNKYIKEIQTAIEKFGDLELSVSIDEEDNN